MQRPGQPEAQRRARPLPCVTVAMLKPSCWPRAALRPNLCVLEVATASRLPADAPCCQIGRSCAYATRAVGVALRCARACVIE